MIEILEARKAQQQAMVRKDKPMPALVFTTTGTTPYSGFSKAKERLDKAMGEALEGVEHWTLHDIRRSVATRMAEDLRIAPHIIEATLNHVSGSKADVAGIYDRSESA
jgi:integrase